MTHSNKPSRKVIERDSYPTFLNIKRGMLRLPFGYQVLVNDARCMHYSRNRTRLILRNDIYYRQYHNKVGNISHLQKVLQVQLLATLLKSLHGTASIYLGKSQKIQEIRSKYYFPPFAKYVRNWVQQCETCIKDKGINNLKLSSELLNVPEWDMGPEDAMQIDLLLELPPSGGYENIVTTVDVFSRYAFVYPVSTPTAVNTAKVIIEIMTRHSYLPTLMITDKGTVFISQVVSKVAAVLCIIMKHATTKHAQTKRVPEGTHVTIKKHH